MGETVGERVRRLREGLGISGAELARRSRVAQTTINQIELGRTENPRGIADIARALGTTADYLLTGRGPEPQGADARDYVGVPRYRSPDDTTAAEGWVKIRRSLLEEMGLVHGDLSLYRASAHDEVPGQVRARDYVLVDSTQTLIADGGIYLVRFDTFLRLRYCARRIADGAVAVSQPSGGPPEVIPVPQLARLEVLGRACWKFGEI